MKALAIMLLAFVLLSLSHAQDTPRPSLKYRIVVTGLQLAATGLDAWRTDQNMSRTVHYESNPVAKPFMGSRPGRIVFFSGQLGLKMAAAAILRRKGHERMARWAEMAGIAENAWGGADSWRHSRK